MDDTRYLKLPEERNRIYRNTVRKGLPIEQPDSLKKMIADGVTLIENAKTSCLLNVGKSLAQKPIGCK